MALTLGKAFIELLLDDDKFQKQTEGLDSTFQGLENRLNKLSTLAAGALTAGSVAAGLFVKQASDAEETLSKFEAVFKEQTAAAGEFADNLAVGTGRSRVELRAFLATVQDTFVPLGFARDLARDLSQQLVALGIDLASFNNEAEDETIQALTSAIVGNQEAVRRYGIVITQAVLDQELLNQGIEGGARAATEQEKAFARLQIILKASSDAQGDAVRTAGSAANQFKALRAETLDLAIDIGNSLLPTAVALVNQIRAMVPAIRRWVEANGDLIASTTRTGARLGVFLIIAPRVVSGVLAMGRAFIFLRNAIAAGTASPAGLIAIAAALAVTAGVTLAINSNLEEAARNWAEIALFNKIVVAEGQKRQAAATQILSLIKQIAELEGDTSEAAKIKRIELEKQATAQNAILQGTREEAAARAVAAKEAELAEAKAFRVSPGQFAAAGAASTIAQKGVEDAQDRIIAKLEVELAARQKLLANAELRTQNAKVQAEFAQIVADEAVSGFDDAIDLDPLIQNLEDIGNALDFREKFQDQFDDLFPPEVIEPQLEQVALALSDSIRKQQILKDLEAEISVAPRFVGLADLFKQISTSEVDLEKLASMQLAEEKIQNRTLERIEDKIGEGSGVAIAG